MSDLETPTAAPAHEPRESAAVRPRLTPPASRADRPIVVCGFLAIVAATIGLGLSLNTAGYDIVVGGIAVLVILLGGVPALRKLERTIPELTGMFGLLWGALVCKMFFSVVRYFFIFEFYDGLGDAAEYDKRGWVFAQLVRKGDLFPKIANLEATEDATRRLTKVTGYVYAVVGHSQYAAFFIFSLFAYIGLVLTARGIQIALPEVSTKRLYVALLFFPSLLFWPAAIGKDAVMILLLGCSVLGAGVLLGPKARVVGLVPFLLGLGGMLMIRPHVGLMSVLALAVAVGLAVVARSESQRVSAKARFIRALLLIVMVLGSVVAAGSVTRLFSEKAGEATSMQGALDETLRLTQVGHSKFNPFTVSTPIDIPPAFVSVFFRPFPWEVSNAQNLLAGLEGLALIAGLVASFQRLRSIPKLIFRRPIAIFAIAYIAMFTVAFANIGNFGILARQRTQALPLIVLLMAFPTRAELEESVDLEPSAANAE